MQAVGHVPRRNRYCSLLYTTLSITATIHLLQAAVAHLVVQVKDTVDLVDGVLHRHAGGDGEGALKRWREG